MKEFIEKDRRTDLKLYFPKVQIQVSLQGGLSVGQRRAWLLAAFERIKPLFRELSRRPLQLPEGGTLAHFDQAWNYRHLSQERGLSLVRALRTESVRENLGFKIRMRRLELGLTQGELARKAKLERAHLSHIEHGRHQMQPQTRARIEKILGPLEEGERKIPT